MRIGVPKEIKDHEYRVGITPDGVRQLVNQGHEVVVEKNAGSRIGYSDDMYLNSGAHVADVIEDVYESDIIVKVKEPQSSEINMFHEGQILFGYLHLAPEAELTRSLVE
ncbi:MAG: alanine dehydrogenase, partial [Gammaproteobacteria bacterium]